MGRHLEYSTSVGELPEESERRPLAPFVLQLLFENGGSPEK